MNKNFKILYIILIICFVFTGMVAGEIIEETNLEDNGIEIEDKRDIDTKIEIDKMNIDKMMEEVFAELKEGLEKIPAVRTSRPRSFKAAFGPQFKLVELNLDEINNIITADGNDFKAFDEVILMSGKQGSIGSRYGSRIGTYKVNGQVSSINPDVNEYKKAELELNYSGFLYEQGLFVGRKTDFAVGFVAGKGSTKLSLIHDRPNNVNQGAQSGWQSIFSRDFIVFEPRLTIHRKLWAFIGVDFTCSYLFTHDLGEDWLFNEYSVSGPAVKFAGPGIALNLSFGF